MKKRKMGGIKVLAAAMAAMMLAAACPTASAQGAEGDADVTGQGTGTTYYVSSQNGNDANNGTSENTAFQSLDKINELILKPGDQVLLERGSVFNEQYLHLKGSGSEDAYIVVSDYGDDSDSMPQINADGAGQWLQDYGKATGDVPAGGKTVSTALLLTDMEYIEVSNLEITNRRVDNEYDDGLTYNDENALDRTGVASVAKNNGTLDHIVLDNLYIHDVQGNVYNKQTVNGGIYFIACLPDDERETGIARYNDVLIQNCYLKDVNRKGIGCAFTVYCSDNFGSLKEIPDDLMQKYGSTNVVIQNNYVEGAGGDAITPQYCYRPVVQYNVAKEAGKQMNTTDYKREQGRVAAAIWPWTCKDAVFQYNESFDTLNAASGNGDGQAWDADTGDGTLYQYNYSHGNTGGAVMFCLQQAVNSTFRYNISQNDGSGSNIGLLSLAKNPDAHIYNNTFYISEGTSIIGTRMGYSAASATIENNIFYYTGDIPKQETYRGSSTGSNVRLYTNNIYYNYANTPTVDTNPIQVSAGEELLTGPGTGPEDVAADHKVRDHEDVAEGTTTAFDGYKPSSENSPAVNAGKVITDQNGKAVEHDFFGNLIIDSPDIGAVEYSTVSADSSLHDAAYIVKEGKIYVPYSDNNPTTVGEFKSNVLVANTASYQVLKADKTQASDTENIAGGMILCVKAQSGTTTEYEICQKNAYDWAEDFVDRQQGNVWFAQQGIGIGAGTNWKNISTFDTTYSTWKADQWHGVGLDKRQSEPVTDDVHGLLAAPKGSGGMAVITAMSFRAPKTGTVKFTVKDTGDGDSGEPYIRQANNTGGPVILGLYVNDKQIIQSELSESFVTADGWRNIPEFEVTAGDYVRVILEGKNAEKRSVHITPNIEYLDIDAENSSPVIELKEKDVLAFGVEKSQ